MALTPTGNEQIYPCTRDGLVSIEYTIPSDGSAVSKGALIRASQTMGFALESGNAGDTINLAIRCYLVEFPSIGEDLKAGDRIIINNDGNSIMKADFGGGAGESRYSPENAIGIVYQDTAGTESRIPLVFAHD